MARPPLVLVVGMHRSGTSLLGGLLKRLGVCLPGETIAGDHHNPEGYFEWDEVVAIQERLLIDLDRWWPSSQGTLALPDGWLQHPATIRSRSKLRQLLICAADRQHSFWAIKDPRCSRLLPLWLQLTNELDIPLQLLLAVRDPAEVVASLMRRDGPLTGMDTNRAQQLWWRHNLEVIEAARSAKITLSVVDFSVWFQKPQEQLEHLLKLLPGLQSTADELQDVIDLINHGHRRSLSGADPQALDPHVRRLYRRLLKQPLPDRMPNSTPPLRLVRSMTWPINGTCLASSPESWDDWLDEHRYFPAPQSDPLPNLSKEFSVELCGGSWMELLPHLLMQRTLISGLECLQLDKLQSTPNHLFFQVPAASFGVFDKLVLNLELPPLERRTQWLGHLRAQNWVLDSCPERVLLLRSCGLKVGWLDPQGPVNGWLNQADANSVNAWALQLGMAPPGIGALILLGPAGASFDKALASEANLGHPPHPSIHYVPGWPELILRTASAGLAYAGWLQHAARQGGRLVYCIDQHLPEVWSCLDGLNASPFCLPPFATPADLRALHLENPLRVLAEDRTSPPQEELFHWSNNQEPFAAVVISLFNYSERIEVALDSVASQTCEQVELIVVDDASDDFGADVVQSWMNAKLRDKDHKFVRLLLIRHQCNRGLATARNTAFAAAKSSWCFVLDSDNYLYPEAVRACLELALVGDEQLAVVHPLLSMEVEGGYSASQGSLMRPQSWQRDRFLFENMVDAMALVRRSAWQTVGGYTHIESGWEDFDFWCKLVDAGFHGMQCPRILAVYRSHVHSMSHTTTNSNWRALSRTLMDRHPWLELPLANP